MNKKKWIAVGFGIALLAVGILLTVLTRAAAIQRVRKQETK